MHKEYLITYLQNSIAFPNKPKERYVLTSSSDTEIFSISVPLQIDVLQGPQLSPDATVQESGYLTVASLSSQRLPTDNLEKIVTYTGTITKTISDW